MIHVKRFIDRVSLVEAKQNKDFVMPITEARGLRDELAKLLVDLHKLSTPDKKAEEPTFQVEFKGGSFK